MRESSIKIIIADDNDETRKHLRELLSTHEGFTVIGEAANGLEAVTLAKKLKPDIVLMDIDMPVMGGIEATRIISVEAPMSSVIAVSYTHLDVYKRQRHESGCSPCG